MIARADQRARLAAAQDAAAAIPVVAQVTPPAGTPEEFSAWAVGPLGGPRSIVVVPALVADAPAAVADRLVARVIATATGLCPLCSRAAGLSSAIPEPGERGRAAFYARPLVVEVRHDDGCPALFDAADARWFVAGAGGGAS